MYYLGLIALDLLSLVMSKDIAIQTT